MKVSIARRNLFSDRTRFAISVGGVAVAILLILTLLGIYRGTVDQSTVFIDNTKADLWVGQAGAHDMFHTFSVLSEDLVDELATVPGVKEIHPLVTRTTSTKIDGRSNNIIVTGYHPDTGIGGPWDIIEGNDTPGSGEVILDKVTMRTNDLDLGDTIAVEGKPHMISGVAQGTNIMIFQYAFVDIEGIRDFLGPGRVSFLMVQLEEPTAAESIKQEISAQYPDLSVFTRDQFALNNAALFRDSFLPIIGVIVVIAFIIGVAIVGLVVYTATLEKYREYGILKAVGASGPKLFKIVFEQSMLSSLIGYIVGVMLAFGVALIISELVVQVNFAFSWAHFVSAFGAELLMSLIAAYIPIRKINSIDPVIVFKE
jgi:putative ABC transport system permease protein